MCVSLRAWTTVYVQIFKGCNFRCFRSKRAIHDIFILEISLARVSSHVNRRAARIEAFESGGDTASVSDDLGDDGKPLPNQLYSIVLWPYKDTWAATIGERSSLVLHDLSVLGMLAKSAKFLDGGDPRK